MNNTKKILTFIRAVGSVAVTKAAGVIRAIVRDREVTVSKLDTDRVGVQVELPVLGRLEFWVSEGANTMAVEAKGFTPNMVETGPYHAKALVSGNVEVFVKRFDGENLMILISPDPMPGQDKPKDYVQLVLSSDPRDIEP